MDIKQFIQDISDARKGIISGLVLYHGSIEIIDEPAYQFHDEDTIGYEFGDGFYLTPEIKEAERWAKTKYKYAIDKGNEYALPIVNRYFLPSDALVVYDDNRYITNDRKYLQTFYDSHIKELDHDLINSSFSYNDLKTLYIQSIIFEHFPEKRQELIEKLNGYFKDEYIQIKLSQGLINMLEFQEFYELD